MKKLLATVALVAACIALSGCVLGSPAEKPADQRTEPPASGTKTTESSDRAALLVALLTPIEIQLGQQAVLKTDRVTIKDGWAFVDGQVTQRDGNPIDYSKTPYKEAVAAGRLRRWLQCAAASRERHLEGHHVQHRRDGRSLGGVASAVRGAKGDPAVAVADARPANPSRQESESLTRI